MQEMKMKIIVTCALLVCLIGNTHGWENSWDQPLNFKCPSRSQTISHVHSVHSNYYEDRKYIISCRDIGDIGSVKCSWTGYVNNFDQPVNFVCDGNGYINGMYSYHVDYYEDRRHKYYCCKSEHKGYELNNCFTTGYLNAWDRNVNYYVPAGHVLRGVYSYHKNYYEDRRTKFKICRLKKLEKTEEECKFE